MIKAALFCQLALLAYHQTTTLVDFHPFNGSRNYTWKEKLAEAGSNAVLMSLAPIGFGFHIKGLMNYGVVYYFVLFAIELIIWWIPYFCAPKGRFRIVYNQLLSIATSNFEKGDALDRWIAVYNRLHRGTTGCMPPREGRPVPNLEHVILHLWTLVTAIITLLAWFHAPLTVGLAV
jgi:hypothetical protein